jgi:hypothetical protein
MKVLIATMTAALVALGSLLAPAQGTIEERLKGVEERLQRAEQENAKLREELGRTGPGETAAAPAAPDELERAIERALEKRTPSEAVTWKDLVKSGNLIQFYGFLRLDAHYNTARPAPNDFFLMWVLPEDGVVAKKDDDSFVLQARWSRLGMNLNAGEAFGAHLTGRFEIDFANYQGGTVESRAAPRIRLAYLDADWGEWSGRFGQDWDVIAPLYPSVHLSGLLWNVGNLGDRRPQAVLGFHTGDDVRFELRGGIGLTGAVDGQNLDPFSAGTSTDLDGFDSGLPHVQVRAGVKTADGLGLGLWGMAGTLETDTRFNGEHNFESMGVGTDVTIPLGDVFSVKGEAWIGQALSDFRGGIGQSVNTATGDEIRSYGGWAELGCQLDKVHKLVGGAALDDPYNRDLSGGLTPGLGHRSRNLTYYLGAIQDWGGGFRTAVEAMYWSTRWVDEGLGTMLRLNVYTQLSF